MGFHEDKLKECIREKFPKNTEVTRTKVSTVCKTPWRTVDSHFDNIIGQDLGDGTKLVHGKAIYDAVVRDPPGDEEVTIEVDPPQDLTCDTPWLDYALGVLTGALAVTTIGLLALAFQRQNHGCSWVPVPGADSWVRVCEICGARAMSLNDQNAPIHFFRVNS